MKKLGQKDNRLNRTLKIADIGDFRHWDIAPNLVDVNAWRYKIVILRCGLRGSILCPEDRGLAGECAPGETDE